MYYVVSIRSHFNLQQKKLNTKEACITTVPPLEWKNGAIISRGNKGSWTGVDRVRDVVQGAILGIDPDTNLSLTEK